MRAFGRHCALLLLAAMATAQRGAAQPFPSQPVKVISDSSPGSAPDVILRVVGEALTHLWGQQVIVINQPGASGSRAARAAAAAPADGYNLFSAASSLFVTMKGTAPGIPIELPGDLVPVSIIAENPMFIVAAPSLGAKNLADVIEIARKKPGEISYAVSGRGRLSHLTGELLQRRTGIKLLMVPYSSGGPAQAIADLTAGRVHLLIEGGSALIGSMEGGSLTSIAVATDARLPEFPSLPAASESVPGFRAMAWIGMLAPAATPEAIIGKVAEDLRTTLTKPDVRNRLAKIGSYTRPMSPQETVKYIQADQQTWNIILEEVAKPPQ